MALVSRYRTKSPWNLLINTGVIYELECSSRQYNYDNCDTQNTDSKVKKIQQSYIPADYCVCVVSQFFNNALMLGKSSESEVSGRLYDVIYELNSISPSVLLAVLPQLEFKLKVGVLRNGP